MIVYCDTSALYALMDASEPLHEQAARTFVALIKSGRQLMCNNYVMLETLTLIQRRLGIEALRAFTSVIQPHIDVFYIDLPTHERVLHTVLTVGRRQLSFADCASFDTMRTLQTTACFAYDPHFAEQGFVPMGEG